MSTAPGRPKQARTEAEATPVSAIGSRWAMRMRALAQVTGFCAALVLHGLASADAPPVFGGGGSTACDPTRQSCAPNTPIDPIGGGAGGGSQTCSASPGGATQCGTGPASQGNNSGTQQGGGNPINIINGNKYQQEVDMPALPGVLGLEIVRHYNSQYSLPNVPTGVMGHGWKLSYETELFDTPVGIQIVQADGTRLIFQRGADDSSPCTSPNPANGSVTVVDKPQGKEYIWRWMGNGKDGGRTLLFNREGKLVQIAAPTGEFVTLLYSPKGWLLQVRDPQGRELNLNYLDAKTARADKDGTQSFRGVQSIDSPVGRFTYGYGDALPKTAEAKGANATSAAPAARQGGEGGAAVRVANLTSVGIPTWHDPGERTHAYSNIGPSRSSITRLYHYEDPRFPTLLTGISVQGSGSDGVQIGQRLSTYGYDSRGKAILSSKADGIEKVTLDTSTPRRTVLTNSLGQKTTYLHAQYAGEWRLFESRGAGCTSCGPANMRYGYDKQARLTEQTELDAQGKPTLGLRSTLDAWGRTRQVERIAYANGKPGAPQWQVRYEYPSDHATEPSLIARPSVVPGKEYQISVRYNAAGQPLEITESGFEPLNGQAIARTTRYAYQRVNGNSVLASIDGPLPNGPQLSPADSDITQLRWDQSGSYIVERTDPGLVTVALAHDGLGRIAQSTLRDGFRQLQTDTRYSQIGNIPRMIESATQTAWKLVDGQPDESTKLQRQTQQTRFDALGRSTQTIDSAGRSSFIQYDMAGRVLGQSDVQGYKSALKLDTEGRTLVAGLYRPQDKSRTDQAGDKPYRAAYQWHDELGRLTQRLLPDGRLDTWAYGANGQLQQHVNGDDIRTRYLTAANKSAELTQTPDGWIRVNLQQREARRDTTPRTLIDDFGRVVRQALPDHGVKVAGFDLADHLTSLVNADGSQVQYDWDRVGHLLRKSYLDANGKLQAETRLSYQGRLLLAAVDPAQTTQYRFDALGRPTGESITLTGLQKPGVDAATFTTTVAYDESTGLIKARTLADGRILRTQRTDAQHGATPTGLTLQSHWVAWLRERIEQIAPYGLAQLLVKALPVDAIASDIQIDPFDGLKGYTAGNGIAISKGFDVAGRMTTLDIHHVTTLQYGYGVGPRIRSIERQEQGQPRLLKASFEYSGFGRLRPWPEGQGNGAQAPGAPAPAVIRTAASRQVSGPVERDALGRVTNDGQYRYGYTPAGQIETVHDGSGKLIARYSYNSLQQRVSKTVGDSSTYFLWQQGKLVAEIDGDGRIQAQYLYLSDAQHSSPLAKLERGQTYFIHTDHRATPMAMTDGAQKIVWQAEITPWGMVRTGSNGEAQPRNQAVLNIRLPGQYFDAETGLHDNWHRSYDPKIGRYLQPDPLGYHDGPDPYLYAGGDPINKADPTGLYEQDMHYYMLFFLALASGMDYEEARITALASQYVDDNPMTRPLDERNLITKGISAFKNHMQLVSYHFVLSDSSDAQASSFGHTLAAYNNTDTSSVMDNLSPQLKNLLSASNTGNPEQPCAKYQFLGEFLHAYADTFSHRDRADIPFDAFNLVGMGAGHGGALSLPDYTYNDGVKSNISWETREDRTLAAEKGMFKILAEFAPRTLSGVSFSSIEATLKEFNATKESGPANVALTKVGILQKKLNELIDSGDLKLKNKEGNLLNSINLFKSEGEGYSEESAKINREKFLKGLKESDFPGTCLPGGTRCKPV